MAEALKTLVVVFTLGSTVWFFSKPFFLSHINCNDYRLRRNSWLLLTVTAFLSPSFWLYVLVALFVIARAIRLDTNPVAHYIILLYVVPPVMIPIPVVGIGALFDLNNFRLLGLTLLLPLLLRSKQQLTNSRNSNAIRVLDVLVILYCTLRIILWDYETVTTQIRTALLVLLDIALPYFAFSRLILGPKQLHDTIATYCLMCMIFVPIALFEFIRSWPLFGSITEQWSGHPGVYITRDGVLRALASTFHPLALGYLLAIALILSLHLFPPKAPHRLARFIPTFIGLGLIAPFSRGPWVAAAVGAIVYRLLSPKPIAGLFKASFLTGIVLGLVLLTPFADKLIQSLPFVGSAEQGSIEYRKELIETTVYLIRENPWFGDPNVEARMAHMIQGEGIVDLVNGYVVTVLRYGLVTLVTLVLMLAQGYRLGMKGIAASKQPSDPDHRQLGVALVAAWICSAVYLGTAGFEHIMWVLLGMLATYARDSDVTNNHPRKKSARARGTDARSR